LPSFLALPFWGVMASLNIAYKGWLWYIHPRDDTGETMVLEPDLTKLVIQKVDVSKSGLLVSSSTEELTVPLFVSLKVPCEL